jgi:hypothetical protein
MERVPELAALNLLDGRDHASNTHRDQQGDPNADQDADRQRDDDRVPPGAPHDAKLVRE